MSTGGDSWEELFIAAVEDAALPVVVCDMLVPGNTDRLKL